MLISASLFVRWLLLSCPQCRSYMRLANKKRPAHQNPLRWAGPLHVLSACNGFYSTFGPAHPDPAASAFCGGSLCWYHLLT